MEDRKFEMNTDGKSFERVLIPQKAYEAVINKVGEIKEFPSSFKDKETGIIKEELKRKFSIDWIIKTPGTAFDKIVSQFVPIKYSKGSGTYSNSKLYDILHLANLGKEFEKANRLLESEVIAWLKEKLPNRLAQISVKTTTSKKGEQYSSVKDIITFLDVPEEIKM
mgnify:FL=1